MPSSKAAALPPLAALRAWAASHLNHYYPALLAYLLAVAFTGAGIICALDGVPYLSALYQTSSAVTATGLVALDMSTLSAGSQVVVFLTILTGGSVLGSVAMPLTRWWNARAALAAHAAAAARAPPRPRSAQAAHVEHQLVAARTLLRDALWVGALLVLAYWAAVQLAVFAVLAVYLSSAQSARALLAARGVSPLWFAAFHSAAAFSNAGMTLFTDNLMAFAEDRAVLLTTACAIPLGNVAAPVALRALLRAARALAPRSVTLDFLLRHPRVAFYNVFDAPATAQLATWVVLFTAYQFVSFLATDLNKAYLAQYPPSSRALIAFFSSMATRAGGFNVVNMLDTSVSQQVVCAVLMYLSATPLLAALAHASKDQAASPDEDHLENSLLEYVQESSLLDEGQGEGQGQGQGRGEGEGEGEGKGEGAAQGAGSAAAAAAAKPTLLQGMRSALPYESLLAVASKEGPLLLLALLVICYAEDAALADPRAPRERSVFGIVFELASAYGTTGLSLSTAALSTSAYFGSFSKLVVIVTMLAGRMRSLPLDVDELASTHSLWELAEEDAEGGAEGSAGGGAGEGGAGQGSGAGGGAPPSPRRDGGPGDQQQQQQQEQEEQHDTVHDSHAFTVGVNLLLGTRVGAARRKSMKAAFAHAPEGASSPRPAASPAAAGPP